jgi:hypothetical protein
MIGKSKTKKGSAAKVATNKPTTPPVRKPSAREADEIIEQADDEQKKRGRPKGSTTKPRGPLGESGVRTKRKQVDDISDTRAAIKRYRDDLNKLVKREKDQHPGSIVRECPYLFASAEREPVPAAFFATSLMGPMASIYGALDVMSVFPSPEHFERLGIMWSECSKHFDFGKWAILAMCIMATAGTVGGAVVQRLKVGPDSGSAGKVKADVPSA